MLLVVVAVAGHVHDVTASPGGSYFQSDSQMGEITVSGDGRGGEGGNCPLVSTLTGVTEI